MCRLVSCVKMDAYADDHGPKRKMVPAPYLELLQAVVIEDAVIYPFAGGAFLVGVLVLLGIPGDAGMEAQVPMVLYVDSAAIAAWGAFRLVGAFLNGSASERAAVFMGVLDRVITPWLHFMPCPAEGMAILIESDIIRGIFRSFGPSIDVDERIDAPALQEHVGGDVVMGGIEADIPGGKSKAVAAEVIDGIKEVLAVMAPGISELHEQGQLDFKLIVPGAEHVEGVAEIPCFIVAVPAPAGIRV